MLHFHGQGLAVDSVEFGFAEVALVLILVLYKHIVFFFLFISALFLLVCSELTLDVQTE
jgi:hypothetical protein